MYGWCYTAREIVRFKSPGAGSTHNRCMEIDHVSDERALLVLAEVAFQVTREQTLLKGGAYPLYDDGNFCRRRALDGDRRDALFPGGSRPISRAT